MNPKQAYFAAVLSWSRWFAMHPASRPNHKAFGIDAASAETVELYGAKGSGQCKVAYAIWNAMTKCSVKDPRARYVFVLSLLAMTCECPVTLRLVHNEDIVDVSQRTRLTLIDLLAAPTVCTVCKKIHDGR